MSALGQYYLCGMVGETVEAEHPARAGAFAELQQLILERGIHLAHQTMKDDQSLQCNQPIFLPGLQTVYQSGDCVVDLLARTRSCRGHLKRAHMLLLGWHLVIESRFNDGDVNFRSVVAPHLGTGDVCPVLDRRPHALHHRFGLLLCFRVHVAWISTR
eukprot:364183-Chlamydomonas_euryale.AAC.7